MSSKVTERLIWRQWLLLNFVDRVVAVKGQPNKYLMKRIERRSQSWRSRAATLLFPFGAA
jgi:hypothetical protein